MSEKITVEIINSKSLKHIATLSLSDTSNILDVKNAIQVTS